MGVLDGLLDKLRRIIQKQDMSQYIEPPGIGIAWLWKLPDTHPFFQAAIRHDAEYDLMREGKSPHPSNEIPDLHFYQDCLLAIAKLDSVVAIEFYLFQAHVFYGLIRTWGSVRWKNNSTQ